MVSLGGSDSRAWYFAEGNTTNQIEMFFVLFNLSAQPAVVRGTYFREGAQAASSSRSASPQSVSRRKRSRASGVKTCRTQSR